MFDLLHKKIQLSSFQLIILGFAGVILLGACVLMLPISSQLRQFTPFSEALFTATSAVCVTGLIVQGTGCYWSAFGQGVILSLIQIGGLGVVTIAVSFSLLSGTSKAQHQRHDDMVGNHDRKGDGLKDDHRRRRLRAGAGAGR